MQFTSCLEHMEEVVSLGKIALNELNSIMLYKKTTKSWDQLTITWKPSGSIWNYPSQHHPTAIPQRLEYIKNSINSIALEEECDRNCLQ